MSVRSISVLVAAVICGGSAAVIVSRLLSAPPSSSVSTIPVVAAKVEIPRGSVIGADMVEIRNWPKEMVPENVVSDIDDVVDRATLMHILPGDLILDSKLADKNSRRGLAAQIPDGMRAYTIQTSKIASSVGGFVLPDSLVDVLLTLKGEMNDGSGGGTSTTLLQAVKILAIDQKLDAPTDNKTADMRSVTLLVTPKQAAFLDLGQNMGQLTLSLRNPADLTESQTIPATLAELRLHQDKPATKEHGAAEDGPMFKIRTLRGTRSGEVAVSYE